MANDQLKRTVGDLKDTAIGLRFPEDIGSLDNNEPGSRKFSLFTIFQRRPGSQSLVDKGFIALPLPKLNDAVNVSYTDVELGVTGAVAIGSMGGRVSGDTENLINMLKTGVYSVNQTSVGRIAADLATSAFPGLRASLVNGLGTIANPYLTNVFKSTGFREYSFSYSLKAKSRTESETITEIVKQFKLSMMPDDILVKSDSASFKDGHTQTTGIQTLPDIFNIRFYPTTKDYNMNDTGKKLFQIKYAVLKNVKVDYSPDTQNPTFFEGTNAPVGVNLTLSFQETTIYTRERCEDDYSSLIYSDTRPDPSSP